jgi:hypothetical protein
LGGKRQVLLTERNIFFFELTNKNHLLKENGCKFCDQELATRIAQLLEVNRDELEKNLGSKSIQIGAEVIKSPLDKI